MFRVCRCISLRNYCDRKSYELLLQALFILLDRTHSSIGCPTKQRYRRGLFKIYEDNTHEPLLQKWNKEQDFGENGTKAESDEKLIISSLTVRLDRLKRILVLVSSSTSIKFVFSYYTNCRLVVHI